jgi:hypothetical protein
MWAGCSTMNIMFTEVRYRKEAQMQAAYHRTLVTIVDKLAAEHARGKFTEYSPIIWDSHNGRPPGCVVVVPWLPPLKGSVGP